MKHTYHIKMRAVLCAAVGIICFASAPAMAQGRDMGCSPTVANPCTGGGGGGGGYSAPSYDYGAARRAQEQAEAAAAAERQRQQAEAERIERERVRQAEEKRQKDAAFIRDRDAAANTLKGSSGGGDAMSQLKGLSGMDNSGLKGSGGSAFDTGLKELRGADRSSDQIGGSDQGSRAIPKSAKTRKVSPQPAPHTDTSVVDARNVPSGLPKALDNAIASAYVNAPPGVSDRVRKGFQAVMSKDWKVAKAWFQDALNRDPTNAGLKRLVALTDTSQQPNKQPATVDLKGATAPPGKAKPATAATTHPNLQLPDPNDIYVAFPGLKKMEDKEALDYLFGFDPYPPASKPGKTR